MDYNQMLEEYESYLDKNTIKYSSGFSDTLTVFINIDTQGVDVNYHESHVDVSYLSYDGKILITDYFGMCFAGRRDVSRLREIYRESFPDCHIYVENYDNRYEIGADQHLEPSSVTDLHNHVVELAHVIEKGIRIGKEMFGDAFER